MTAIYRTIRRVTHLGDLDLPDRLAPAVPAWATQAGVGVTCAAAAGLLRLAFDALLPGAAPFALVFPALMLATLLARWQAGVIAAFLTIVYAWFYIFPLQAAIRFNDPTGARTTFVVVLASALTIVLAEAFRRAVRRANDERDREIADRDLFLEEVDHRMKNNFAIVAGLLDMQRRRAADPAVADALATAQARVDSIGRAHRHLYRGSGQPGVVEMHDYLGDLCTALSEALFLQGGIRLACETDPASVPRDRAVSIGLVVNELVTNAAKHAFPNRDLGTIQVAFRNRPGGGWIVTVSDDGVGLPETCEPTPGHGLGTRLTEAFARQAGGTLTTDSDRTGTRVTLELAG